MITCLPQEPPEHGAFRNILTAEYGSVIEVDCDEGYFLSGDNGVECVDKDNDGDGEWDKTFPTCASKQLRLELFILNRTAQFLCSNKLIFSLFFFFSST